MKRFMWNLNEFIYPPQHTYSFLKNQNWPYLWIDSLESYTFCFYCMPSWGLLKYYKLSCKPLAFTSYKNFERKYFYYIPLTGKISLAGGLHFVRYMYCSCLLTRLCRLYFEIKLYLSDQAVFITWIKKSRKRKQLLRWIKKHFSSFLEGFYWSRYFFWKVRVRL